MLEDARTSPQMAPHGWRMVSESLAHAKSEDELLIHWFLTPRDADVHSDPHWHDNARVAKFVRVVIPTLADQLQASMLAVAVPWDVGDEQGLLALVTLVVGQPAALQTRRITRTALADAAPYWRLEDGSVEPPPELSEIVARLSV